MRTEDDRRDLESLLLSCVRVDDSEPQGVLDEFKYAPLPDIVRPKVQFSTVAREMFLWVVLSFAPIWLLFRFVIYPLAVLMGGDSAR